MSIKGKKILVTSGGTQEYIDDVRVLTNISSGKLGAEIAKKLVEAIDHTYSEPSIFYLHGRNTCMPCWSESLRDGIGSAYLHTIEVRSAQDAYNEMERLVPKMDAVIHCMAVSDFTFKRDKAAAGATSALKCSSSDTEAFIEYMRQTITKNPKIIGKVKEWNPKAILIGFKFEVGKTVPELVALADESIVKNGCDLVVANDKAEMVRWKEHITHFVFSPEWTAKDWMFRTIKGKEDTATEITNFLEAVL